MDLKFMSKVKRAFNFIKQFFHKVYFIFPPHHLLIICSIFTDFIFIIQQAIIITFSILNLNTFTIN